MASAVIVARYFSNRYRLEKQADIDEMKLHKLLYLAQRESLVRYDKPLFPEGIYAYQYGPVVKEVREAFRHESVPDAPSLGAAAKQHRGRGSFLRLRADHL